MQPALIVTGVLVAFVCGVVQLASMSLYGDLAQEGSVPALLPPSIGITLAAPLASRRAPASLRAAYAQALLHRGDISAATAIVRGLPDRADTADLRGQVAEIAGDPAAALAAYARAGDFERAQRLIDAAVDAHRYAAAAGLEAVLANALSGDGQAAVRARAFWRAGQIAQLEAVADAGRREVLGHQSLEYYTRALAIAPNEETYLLAAGEQALTLGDKAAARAYYLRALEAVPDSADARAGLLDTRL